MNTVDMPSPEHSVVGAYTPGSVHHQVGTDSKGAHILIVDDDPDTQTIVSVLIHMIGWETKSASNGASALDQVAAECPALIMLDLMMPGMSGFEVLKHLKANPQTRNIPVIVISALGKDKRLLRLGVSKVIAKGEMTINTLREAIAEVLDTPHTET